MAKGKQVEQITDMEVDFPQWYTDVCKKAELIDYSGVKGLSIDPMDTPFGKIYRGYWIVSLRTWDTRMSTCLCSYQRACCRKKKIM